VAVSCATLRVVGDAVALGNIFGAPIEVAREPVYIAEGELRGDRRAAKKIPDYA